MGVKKSTVCTRAWSGAILYTPAASAWSKPTRTFGSCCRANFPSTVSSAAGLSLDAQPAAFTDSVRRNGLASAMVHCTELQSVPRSLHHGDTEESRGITNPTQEFSVSLCLRGEKKGYLLHRD